MGVFTKLFSRKKRVTTKEDYIAYTSGAKNSFTVEYNNYLASVETIERVVRVYANIASMAKLEVVKKTSTGKLVPYKIKNIDLDFSINEIDSQADFLRKTFSSLCTQGASIILAETSKTTGLVSFYPYDPAKFKIEATEKSLISKFIYTTERGVEIPFDAKDVIYINSTIDVSNMVYPISRMKALKDILVLQANIMNQTSEYYASGSKNSVIITPKEPMSPDKAKALKTTFDEFIKARRARALFLNSEVDVQAVSNAQTPADIMAALVEINKTIIASFGVPDYLFGNYKDALSDAAIKTACRLFFEVQMKPLFKTFEHQMTRYFRNTLELKDVVVRFDFSNVEILHDSYETKVTLAGQLMKLGLTSINEARALVELPILNNPVADEHFLMAHLVSSRPVTLENYQGLLDSGFFDKDTEREVPSGATGGKDNETQLTKSDKGGI